MKSKGETEKRAAYYAALELIERIDASLKWQRYRTKAGELLTSLDEVCGLFWQGSW